MISLKAWMACCFFMAFMIMHQCEATIHHISADELDEGSNHSHHSQPSSPRSTNTSPSSSHSLSPVRLHPPKKGGESKSMKRIDNMGTQIDPHLSSSFTKLRAKASEATLRKQIHKQALRYPHETKNEPALTYGLEKATKDKKEAIKHINGLQQLSHIARTSQNV